MEGVRPAKGGVSIIIAEGSSIKIVGAAAGPPCEKETEFPRPSGWKLPKLPSGTDRGRVGWLRAAKLCLRFFD